jgi:hypothetical protein
MSEHAPERLSRIGRWHSRPVTYWGGRWAQLRAQIPQFQIDDFRVSNESTANPYLKSVVRLPMTLFEQAVPVGVVSSNYALVQHNAAAERCFDAIQMVGIEPDTLRCELGLTELGEWMNLRIYFPDRYSHIPSDHRRVDLCLECFNSVEGTSRLIVLFGWVRLICSNGMVIRETQAELSDLHNKNIDLERITKIVNDGLKIVGQDLDQISRWTLRSVRMGQIGVWANTILSSQWGKKAACRVYNICRKGFDVEYADAFAPGAPTEKAVVQTCQVPGASAPAENLYDVSQALAWVATTYTNTDERLEHQSSISDLIEKLGVIG